MIIISVEELDDDESFSMGGHVLFCDRSLQRLKQFFFSSVPFLIQLLVFRIFPLRFSQFPIREFVLYRYNMQSRSFSVFLFFCFLSH